VRTGRGEIYRVSKAGSFLGPLARAMTKDNGRAMRIRTDSTGKVCRVARSRARAHPGPRPCVWTRAHETASA